MYVGIWLSWSRTNVIAVGFVTHTYYITYRLRAFTHHTSLYLWGHHLAVDNTGLLICHNSTKIKQARGIESGLAGMKIIEDGDLGRCQLEWLEVVTNSVCMCLCT